MAKVAKEKADYSFAPLNTIISWSEGVSRKKDAIALAKGHIKKRFTAVESSWYAVAPFLGGYLWEAQEGGQGVGYIDSVIKALNDDPSKEYWFPSGDRAFRIMMRDGKPFGVLLSEAHTEKVFASGVPPLLPVSKMYPAERKGTATLAVGLAMGGSGALFMLSSMIFYGLVANPGPSVPAANFAELPHAQWNKVVGTKVTEIVSKLQFKDNNWETVMRPHEVPGLLKLQQETQTLLDKVKQDITPMPAAEPDPLADDVNNFKEDVTPSEAPVEGVPEVTAPSGLPANIEALKKEVEKKNLERTNNVDGNNPSATIPPTTGNEGASQ